MSNRTKIRKARKEYRCTEGCHTIKHGEHYLHSDLPPWHEINQSGKWQTIRACLSCAKRHCMHTSETREQLERLTMKDKKTLDYEDVHQLVLDMRIYIIRHGIQIDECVAWNHLKKLVDVGQTRDCPSEVHQEWNREKRNVVG